MAKRETPTTIVNENSEAIVLVPAAPEKPKATYTITLDGISLDFGKSSKVAKSVRDQLKAQGKDVKLILVKEVA